MNDRQFLQKLQRNGGTLDVLMGDRRRSAPVLNDLAELFAHASAIGSKAGIAEIRINFTDLGHWKSDDLDVVVRATQRRVDSGATPRNSKRTLKMGYWYEKKDSYMFRIYEKRLDGLGPAAE